MLDRWSAARLARHSYPLLVLGLLGAAPLLSLAGCQAPLIGGSPTPAPTATWTPLPDAWTPLRARPLNLPSLAQGATCPANPAHHVLDNYGDALGDGPAYVLIGGDTLDYAPAANFYSGEWGGNRILWLVNPQQSGPILVRGHQLDGPSELRFGTGAVPATELTFMASGGESDGWSSSPFTDARVRAPGCYAFQVDGTTFTEVIVFEAQPA